MSDWFRDLPQSRPYKLGLLGAGGFISYCTVKRKGIITATTRGGTGFVALTGTSDPEVASSSSSNGRGLRLMKGKGGASMTCSVKGWHG